MKNNPIKSYIPHNVPMVGQSYIPIAGVSHVQIIWAVNKYLVIFMNRYVWNVHLTLYKMSILLVYAQAKIIVLLVNIVN